MNEQGQPAIKYFNYKPRKWYKKLFSPHPPYNQLNDRKIISNVPDPQLSDNCVQTAKYHLITFFPVNLVQQFTKPSNIYFLLIGILQIIPQISVSQGKPTMFFPLTIVVLVSMIKDFLQDWKRHISDKKQNQSEVQIISEIGIVKRKWQSLLVGQIIKVKKDQYFPCDILLLYHSPQQKAAFIQTKNLDGQNNLKLKKIPEHLQKNQIKDILQFSNIKYEVNYQKPNPFLNTFNGNMKIGQKKYMLDNNHVVLRGCSLKINQYAIGMCLYNGHESKIFLNSGNPHPKKSHLQLFLNQYFKYIFIFQLVVTLISSIAYGIIIATNYSKFSYFDQSPEFFVDSIYTWGSWFISFSNFIPISLLVTVEFVRFGQGKIIGNDQLCKSKMYAEVQTSSVNQELGQLQYILTDKTGTLTKNQMDFKFVYIDGISYGSNQFLMDKQQQNIQDGSQITQQDDKKIQVIQIQQQQTKRQSLLDKIKKRTTNKISKNIQETQLKFNVNKKPQNVDFPQSQKIKLLKSIKDVSIHKDRIKLALVHLAICHNVINQGDSYTSSSPDEVALVSFARYIGYRFIKKNDHGQIEIQEILPGQKPSIIKYSLLHVLEFSSQRKRMSVIVKQIINQQQKILLMCKGADDIILSRLTDKSQNNTQETIKNLHLQLYNYACKGLRTLVLAYKQISLEEYTKWQQRYSQSLTIITNQRLQKINQLQSEIQNDLDLVGATAIEDKLQDQVKQTISQLKKSNIKVWMLTGDKRQTAVSIGYSCGLIDKFSEVITLDCQHQHAANLINNVYNMIHLITTQKVTVLSGDLITKLDDVTKETLSKILKQSISVICCRVSPKGKEQITKIVKQWGRTLAIGDGANDVNMINSAHVGVGVRGIQGSQATRAADYIISQFKILKRLVLFYGLNFYHRNCGVIIYTLYKNILVTFPILFYGPLSVQSATYIYQTWIFQFFNIFFVSLPIIYYGLFDTIYSQKTIIKKPFLYSQGQKSKYLTRSILIRQIITTAVMSFFLVFTVYFINQQSISSSGYMIYQQWSGMLVFNTVVITANIRIITMSHQINMFQFSLVLSGIIMYYIFYFVVEIILYSDIKNTLGNMIASWQYWLLIILYIVVLEGYEYVMRSLKYMKISTYQRQIKETLIQEEIKQFGLRKSSHNLTQINQQKKLSMSGYAFAQAQQRSMLIT